MNLLKILRLDCNTGDVIILRRTLVNNDLLTQLFAELAKIKLKQKAVGKLVNYIVLTNQWAKLLLVNITDIKGAMYQIDQLLKQLVRMQDGLANKLKILGNADALSEKILLNLEYVKAQRGM